MFVGCYTAVIVHTGVAPTKRRTQAERRAATRAALLEATIGCVSELGYARTTTTEIARRAGVSRGAQLHHFPSKAELVTAALEELYERRFAEFREAMTSLPTGVNPYEAAVDVLWPMVSGPTFVACLELQVAARTDLDLRPVVVASDRRFFERARQVFLELLPPPSQPDPNHELAPSFTFALLEGLALRNLQGTAPDDEIDRVLEGLKGLARLFMPAP